MTDKAAERAAMLAKIKANMAATRERIATQTGTAAPAAAGADRTAAREAMLSKIKADVASAKEKSAAPVPSAAAEKDSGEAAAVAAAAAEAPARAEEPTPTTTEADAEAAAPQLPHESKEEGEGASPAAPAQEETPVAAESPAEVEESTPTPAPALAAPGEESAEEVKAREKQAMLEKIRKDMEETRARLAKMKERQSVLFPQTSADAAPPAGSEVIVRTKADGSTEKVIRVKKGSLESSTITGPDGKVLRVRKVDASSGGRRPSVDTRRPSIASRDEPRRPSIASRDEARRPSVGGRDDGRRPSVGGRGDKPIKRGANGKNIRSLEDLQKAIQKADRVKKQVQTQGKIDQLRRDRQKQTLTKEEKRQIRQSRRMTMELQASEARVKVDTQINNFMLMMNSLEGEWQKMEDARVKRENEIEAQRICFEKAGETMAFLTTTVQDLQAQVDHLKVVLDRVVEHVPKAAKKDEKWLEQLKNFQENYLSMRHTLFVNSAKHKKMSQQAMDQARKMNLVSGDAAAAVSAATAIPGAPPPPPSPRSSTPIPSGARRPAAVAKSNPITDLLSQIQQGTSLRKLDPEKVKQERAERKGNWRQSVNLLRGLQDTLREALDQRQLAMLSDSDEDDYDDWDEDDEVWDD